MKSSNTFSLRQIQNGAALVISLLLLLVMTILAISMSTTTRLQERMAGNMLDVSMANWSSESGLRGAEDQLAATGGAPSICNTPGSCLVLQKGYFDAVNFAATNDAWWAANGTEYGTPGQDLSGVVADPKYVIEYAGDDKELHSGLTIGHGVEKRRSFYQITSASHGKTPVANSVTQSIYALVN